jgi:uncharacterized protein YjbI with pentapeptide repeats
VGEGIDLLGASLAQASLRGANLQGALLEECNLAEADLTGSNFTGAKLLRVNIKGATLDDVILERADLSELNGWEAIRSLTGAKISGVRNAPDGFREWAVAHGALELVPAKKMSPGKLMNPEISNQGPAALS